MEFEICSRKYIGISTLFKNVINIHIEIYNRLQKKSGRNADACSEKTSDVCTKTLSATTSTVDLNATRHEVDNSSERETPLEQAKSKRSCGRTVDQRGKSESPEEEEASMYVKKKKPISPQQNLQLYQLTSLLDTNY